MANSDFWRDLAVQFRALDPSVKLRADWYCTISQSIGNPPQTSATWAITEAWKTTSLCLEFDALARRAGSEIADPEDPHDSLTIWLDAVRKETASPGMSGGGVKTNSDGSTELHQSAEIPAVCEASADLCKVLESRALEGERDQRIPPETTCLDQESALRKLRGFGVTVPIDEITASTIMAELLIIAGRVSQGAYRRENSFAPPQHIYDAYHAIAKEITHFGTPDEVLENMIPSVVRAFALEQQWRPRLHPATMNRFYFHGPITEWKGKKLRIEAQEANLTRVAEPLKIQQRTPEDAGALRDRYLSTFPDEKIKVLDICWAASQHYREWKRWLAGDLKPGSTPDRAFRRLLSSGKKPSEYKAKLRPKRWE